MGVNWSRRRVLAMAPAVAGVVISRFRLQSQSTPTASPGASPVASPMATPVQSGRPVSVADTVTIELTDFGFRPDYVQATNGHDLHVTLRNTGTRKHGFRIERLDVNVTVKPGMEKTVTIESPPLGDFTFTSDERGDEAFEGTLVFYI